jgi:tetratricopeptide (TPR) repeat protein
MNEASRRLASWSAGVFIGLIAALLLGIPAAAQVQQMDAGRAPGGVARAEERPPELDRQFRRAEMAWRRGANLLEAKARLDHLLGERPDDLEARKLRAEVLLEMDRPGAALRDADHAAEFRPRGGMAHLLRAEAARRDSQPDLARRALDRAAEHLPQKTGPHVRLSWNAMRLGRLAQAEAFARVAVALDSSAAPAYRQLARVFTERGSNDEAASVLARGLRAGALKPRALREDERLRSLADHPRLQGLVRR